MPSNEVITVDNIDGDLCQFEVGDVIGNAFELLEPSDYPAEYRDLIDDINRRGQNANDLYRMAKHREQMFASGFQAGMYIAKFDENEELTSFEFTDGTRRMLGYDGLEDLPNEFDSWVKTLIPEEKDTWVKIFWDSVKMHRELPDISHAEYRMMKKDGSIIWVTGAGEFIRREDGSLEMYIGCYREVTAEHEREEYLRIIEGVGKIFNFSLYIDAKTSSFKLISSNEYIVKDPNRDDAFEFLRENVRSSVDDEYGPIMLAWLDRERVLEGLREDGMISMDFHSAVTDAWYKGVFLISDRDENGDIAHIIYGCQDIDASKKLEIANHHEILSKYRLLKAVSNVYNSLHEIDLVNNTAFPYNSNAAINTAIIHTNGADLMMRKAMEATVTAEYLEIALAFTDLNTISERLRGRNYVSIDLIGKNLGWFTAAFIVVEHNDFGDATKVVFATKSIDDIKRKEESLIYKSNTDELTGAYNRRAYEEGIAELKVRGFDEDFVYISVDVNGLKVVNDTLGHAAGDELIVGAYHCINDSFKRFGKVFRTGGDEFVVLANVNTKLLCTVLATMDASTEKWSGKIVDSLSLSYGYVEHEEETNMNIEEIAVLADNRMYESKNLYYKTKGIDRRGRKDAHIALCSLYTKILKINLTDDTFLVVDMDELDKSEDKGYTSSISKWLRNFGEKGQVHPDDLEDYYAKTNTAYLEEYFSSGKTSLHILYRRKYGDEFKQVMMEIIPANDYSEDNHSYFLYVKNIDV